MNSDGKKTVNLYPCAESEYLYQRYRAVWEAGGKFGFPGLIEEGTALRKDKKDFRFENLSSFVDVFDPSGICWKPSDAKSGEGGLFFEYAFPLTRGGREEPYPRDIPTCLPTQGTKRVLIEISTETPAGMLQTAAAKTFLPQFWVDPSDQYIADAQSTLGEIKATGLCQKKVSEDPDRFGLFLTHSKTLDELKDTKETADLDQEIETSRAIRDTTPEAMRRCAPPDDYLAEYAALGREINTELGKRIARSRDPILWRITAPRVAEAIFQKVPLSPDKKQYRFLINLLAFGIEGGLSSEGLTVLADRIRFSGDNEEFLYRLLSAVALEVARGLVRALPRRVDFLDGFDAFAEEIGGAIADGRIGIQIRTWENILSAPASDASYSPMDNKIVIQPFDDTTPIEQTFMSIIHELTHAYQDKLSLPLTILEQEEWASTWEHAAKVLLFGERFQPMVSEDIDIAARWLSRLEEEEKKRENACWGKSEAYLMAWKNHAEEERAWGSLWERGISLAIEGKDHGDLSAIFHEYYRRVAYNSFDQGALFKVFEIVAEQREIGAIESLQHFIMDKLISKRSAALERMEKAPPMSKERAWAADKYLLFHERAWLLFHFIDRSVQHRLEQDEIERFDVVGEALLYLPSLNDGIPPR